MGELGGFYQAIDLLVFMLGHFFSSRMFMASIASKLYFRKLDKTEIQNKRKPDEIPQTKQRLDSSSAKIVSENESPRAEKVLNDRFFAENYEQIRISFKNILRDTALGPFYRCFKKKDLMH